MSEPIVFITTLEIHEGKLQEFQESAKKTMEFQEANGPQLMMGVYIDEKNMLARGFQVHRDSESILSAWRMADPYMREVMQYTTTRRVEVYGQPNDAVMEGMRRLAGSGASVAVLPRLVGFSRFQEGMSA